MYLTFLIASLAIGCWIGSLPIAFIAGCGLIGYVAGIAIAAAAR